jgi:integrase
MTVKLTETIVSKLPTPQQPKLHADDATPALYLKVAASGRKTFQYRSRRGGAWDTRTLGTWPDMSLDAARRAVRKLNSAATPAPVLTFGDLLDEWYSRRIEPHYKVTRNIQTYVQRGKEWLGTVKLTSLTTRQTVDKLAAYADVAPVGANRCLSNWKLCLDYAVERGYLEANPLARTTSRVVGGTEKSRSRVLTDAEVVAVFALEHRYGPLLRALLLTGCRISELQAARPEHVEGDILHVPDNKSARPHWVTITPLLREQFGDFGGYMFADRSPTAVQAWLKRGGLGWTPHDLRRTFATRLAGLGVAPHVVEKCLNHQMQGVLAIYNRETYAPERIAAAARWTAKVTDLTQ